MPTGPERGRQDQQGRRVGRGAAKARRLAQLKRQIESGEYETPEKLEATLRRMIEDLRRAAPDAAATRGDDSGGESP